ncbi:MAG: hypothetical protein JEZ10_00295 [Verrucomicrobia bacterium]|nr:hypothetical protein [Verrucomicrobiota bacterium]
MRPVFEAARYPEYGPVYPFAFSNDCEGSPKEGATVRFAWDESGLYVSAELEDSCLIQQNREDQQLHYQTGDVLELFVKPLHAPYKWEMYATPFGNKTTLFFPEWPSELTPEQALNEHDFQCLEVTSIEFSKPWKNNRVEAQPRCRSLRSLLLGIPKALSEYLRSKGWKARMFVPASQLTALGAGWGEGTKWTVFCGRYNYNSEDLSDPELSMAPALSATDYHLIEEYALLDLKGDPK